MKTIDAIAKAVVLACALLTLGAVFVWAAPCQGALELASGNMTPMKCHWAARAAALMALVMAVASAAGLIARKPVDGLFAAVAAALGCAMVLVTLETPLSIGVCASPDMACHATAAWIRACGVIAALAPLAALVAHTGKHQVK